MKRTGAKQIPECNVKFCRWGRKISKFFFMKLFIHPFLIWFLSILFLLLKEHGFVELEYLVSFHQAFCTSVFYFVFYGFRCREKMVLWSREYTPLCIARKYVIQNVII